MESAVIRALSAIGLSLAVLALFAAGLAANTPSSLTERCLGKPASIVGSSAADRIDGTPFADTIVTGPGADVVRGHGGNDRICSGEGSDRLVGGVGSDSILAGAGDDTVRGSNGSDHLRGEFGRDLILGNRGNDEAWGGPGSGDYADGGLGDDDLDGGSGSFDQIIGSVGNDQLAGGPGREDSLRGDRGADLYDGGRGAHDVASFAVSGFQGPVAGGQGVAVDVASGRAERDGKDRLRNVEDVIGTAFADVIRGDSAVNTFYGGGGDDRLLALGPSDAASGGGGSDSCEGFAQAHSCGNEESAQSTVLEASLAGGPVRSSLTVVVRPPNFIPGAPIDSPRPAGADINVSFENGEWSVTGSSLPIVGGEGCAPNGGNQVRCPVSNRPDAVLISGGAGDDEIEITPSVPSTVGGIVQGDRGADLLLGGPGDDSLNGAPTDGPYPSDVVLGRGGDDALTSGASLDGGTGSDLLIGGPCIGQILIGGAGADSASFARTPPGRGVGMQLGRTAVEAESSVGSGPVAVGCPAPGSQPTRIHRSIENVEGSPEGDILAGDGAPNILLGRGGDDKLIGLGGSDFLVGGKGVDSIFGEQGWDRLYARDGARDRLISCGGGGARRDVASLDGSDPAAPTCRLLP